MDPGISLADLLAYNTAENDQWKRWFTANPAALDLPCDAAGAGTVRKLVLHIFSAELFLASRLYDEPRPDFEKLPHATLDELFAITTQAREKFDRFLATATPEQWATSVVLFRDLRASKRKIFLQAITHSIHHRAQLATSLRQQGYQQDWIHDFIASKAID
jgi:uncharacterized damage-inducible protein DinB